MFDLPLLIVQLLVILASARVAGFVVRRFGQPQVVGEMLAGVGLGPGLSAAVGSSAIHMLFPSDRMVPLATISQLGALLFVFTIGLRVNGAALREHRRMVVSVSLAGTGVPCALGVAMAVLLHRRIAPPGAPIVPFALFIGTAMGVTAFPVLARILDERRLLQSRIGMVALVAAGTGDVVTWCMLAAAVTARHAPPASTLPFAVVRVAGIVIAIGALVAVATAVGRPALDALARRRTVSLGAMLIWALAASWITGRIGVHALIGAFIAGATVPRPMAAATADRIEPLVTAMLLPVFFTITGLQLTIPILTDPQAWRLGAVIFVVAVVGKLGSVSMAARSTGATWSDAVAIGLLMNARGLVELIVLNVGLDAGLISAPLFAMFVLMALASTMMTTPLITALALAPSPMGKQLLTKQDQTG